MYNNATPFHFVKALDRVVYYPHFRHTNPDLFEVDQKDRLDSVRIAQNTSWTPLKGPELTFVTPYPCDAREQDDRIDLLFSAA